VHKKTHIKLADQVASKIGLNICSQEAAYLRQGSVVPDDWRDFPHHYGKDSAIRSRIVKSRKALLEDRKDEACYHLGVAFHYLADRWTLMTGSDERHASWEQLIEDSSFVENVNRLIERSDMPAQDKSKYCSFLRKLDYEPLGKDETLQLASLWRPSTWSTPSTDLNVAYKICLKIARSVFSSPIPPPAVLKQIEETGKRLERTANRFFYFLWFVSFAVAGFGVISLLVVNFWAFMALGLAFLLIELFSMAMFPVQRLSGFKNVQRLCSTIMLWKALTLLLPLFFILLNLYFGIPWTFLFYSSLGFFVQWCLSLYLYYKPGVNRMGTYVTWYKKPEPVKTAAP
jgi:hypothetical protein